MVCKFERDVMLSKELVERDVHNYMIGIFFFFPIPP